MAGDPRLTARPGHAACTASPETYRNPAQGSFRHAVNGTRFGPEHPNIPSREVGRFPCSALRETVQVLKNPGIKLTSWSRRSWQDRPGQALADVATIGILSRTVHPRSSVSSCKRH
jgi:hypothetical protein